VTWRTTQWESPVPARYRYRDRAVGGGGWHQNAHAHPGRSCAHTRPGSSARAHRSCTPAPHAPESGELHRARGGKGVRGWLPHPVRTRGGRLAGETHTVCAQNLHVPLATTPGGSFRAPTPARSGALIRSWALATPTTKLENCNLSWRRLKNTARHTRVPTGPRVP